jgi:tetratricopeptide (TPR) repeat protein
MMLRKSISIRLSFLIALMVILSGCKTYEYFNINVLEPGTLFLPSRYRNILITHNIQPDNSKSAGSKLMVLDEDYSSIARRDSLFANISVVALADMLNQAGRFGAGMISTDSIVFPKNPLDFTEEHIAAVRSLCIESNAEAIVILNNLRLIEYFDIFYNDFSIPFGYISSEIAAQWLLIDPFSQKLIDAKNIRDTLYSRVSNPYDYLAGFDELTYIVPDEYAVETALDYGGHISPHFVSTQRLVFKSGHKNIRRGYNKVKSGDWKQAANEWRKAMASGDQRIQAKATFNLALAAEMEGLPEAALSWARQSYNFFPDSVNSVYIRILQERLNNQLDIIRQMEGE